MEIKRIVVGQLETNCYVLKIENEVLIIDPGDNPEKIVYEIGDAKVTGIIVTHYHFDHIGALDKIKNFYKTKVYDFHNMKEEIVKIENFEFEVIYTPGHKDDLISIYFKNEKALFCGDFIFENSIGRCDLEGGDFFDMQRSIEKILKYPLETTVYTGHGNFTSLQNEKHNLEQYL